MTVVLDGVTRMFTARKGQARTSSTPGLRNGIELPLFVQGRRVLDVPLQLVEGEVDMDVNFALEDYEVARGFILACQSYPVTDRVTVDFDQTGHRIAP